MKTTLLVSALIAGAVLAPAPVRAHDDKTVDAVKAPNGGQLRMAGVYHYELVTARDADDTKENPVLVYVTDHADAKVPTAGASGSATILAGKGKAVVALVPDGENRMKGSGRYLASPEMKVVVSITLPGKPAAQARFTPMQGAR